MAIDATVLTTANDTTNRTAYTTASVTPSANKLILIAVAARESGAGTPPRPVSVIGNGITYDFVDETALIGDRRRGFLFRGMGSSPTAGTIVIDFDNTQTACLWSVVEFGGVDTSGSNGAGAVVQSDNENVTAANSITATLAAFGDATNNSPYIFLVSETGGGDRTEESGYIELADQSNGGVGFAMAWDTGEDLSPSYTVATTADLGAVAIEIKVAVAADDGNAQPFFQDIGNPWTRRVLTLAYLIGD